MNSKIKKGRVKFNDENYEEALKYFNEVSEDDEDYMYVLIFKITCLMELERYDKALFLIESLLREDPEDELLLYEKIRCHIALNEKDEAFAALKIFENVISGDDKRMLLCVSKFYRLLGDYDNSLKFCCDALKIDGDFEEAVREKSLIGIALNDYEMINSCADRLCEIISDRGMGMAFVFLLKLYVSRFDDCLLIIDYMGDEFNDDTLERFKSIVFKELCETLDVNLHVVGEAEISVDEAIRLLMDYDENGVDSGRINGVAFKIM